jgi:hypothetical protein
MSTFYVTFGQQYRHEAHPTFPKAHPDGWVTVVAADELAARSLAVERLGTAWSSGSYRKGGVGNGPLLPR